MKTENIFGIFLVFFGVCCHGDIEGELPLGQQIGIQGRKQLNAASPDIYDWSYTGQVIDRNKREAKDDENHTPDYGPDYDQPNVNAPTPMRKKPPHRKPGKKRKTVKPGNLGKYFVYVNCTSCKVKSELRVKGAPGETAGPPGLGNANTPRVPEKKQPPGFGGGQRRTPAASDPGIDSNGFPGGPQGKSPSFRMLNEENSAKTQNNPQRNKKKIYLEIAGKLFVPIDSGIADLVTETRNTGAEMDSMSNDDYAETTFQQEGGVSQGADYESEASVGQGGGAGMMMTSSGGLFPGDDYGDAASLDQEAGDDGMMTGGVSEPVSEAFNEQTDSKIPTLQKQNRHQQPDVQKLFEKNKKRIFLSVLGKLFVPEDGGIAALSSAFTGDPSQAVGSVKAGEQVGGNTRDPIKGQKPDKGIKNDPNAKSSPEPEGNYDASDMEENDKTPLGDYGNGAGDADYGMSKSQQAQTPPWGDSGTTQRKRKKKLKNKFPQTDGGKYATEVEAFSTCITIDVPDDLLNTQESADEDHNK